jgi:MoaA/NifB/PqqE/SkfB family radical SAM enzyme
MHHRFCKLWIYTNLNCNLTCTYCVAESSPQAPSRQLALATVERLVDEAVGLGFQQVFLTGGEPFLLKEIFDMLAYAAAHLETVVLTNALLLQGRRLDRLTHVANANLIVQVSLDGARPEHHDPYRGAGTWAPTVKAIQRLQGHGIRVRLSTTETPINGNHLDELVSFRRGLGIGDDDHVVRPLARRGFARCGVEVDVETLAPELTVNSDGVFWHPLASPSALDMKVSNVLELAPAIANIQARLKEMGGLPNGSPQTIT